MNLNTTESWLADTVRSTKALTSKVRSHTSAHRTLYCSLALLLFLSGLLLSLYSMELEDIRLRPIPIAANILVCAPLSLALKAISLQAAAHVIGKNITFKAAFQASSIATISNVLPIPAGTAVQSAALIKEGASISRGGAVVMFGNFVSMAIVSVVLGIGLSANGHQIGILIMCIGLIALGLSLTVTMRVSNRMAASRFIGTRIARVCLMIVRVQISFLAIGFSIGLTQAASFTAAIVLGSAVVIAPAGLGVSESLAAMTALAVSVVPAAAFIAVALNRLTTLLVAASAAACMISIRHKTPQ